MAILICLLFANGWVGGRNKRDPEGRGIPRILNGIGLGVLPATAVWKAFEQETFLGAGTEVAENLVQIPLWTDGGVWQPCRIEFTAALIGFVAICLWLILRKTELPENGDLLGIAIAVTACVRIVTEEFRANQAAFLGESRVAGWIAAGLGLIVMIVWAARTVKKHEKTGYAFVCVPVYIVMILGIALMRQNGWLAANAPAELVIEIVAALIALKALICMGRVSR